MSSAEFNLFLLAIDQETSLKCFFGSVFNLISFYLPNSSPLNGFKAEFIA